MIHPTATEHGATQGATGSWHQLHLNANCSILIDCSLFQAEAACIDLPIGGIKAPLLTRNHLDNVGRTPDLLSAGFSCPINFNHPTAKLLPLVPEDALVFGAASVKRDVERAVSALNA